MIRYRDKANTTLRSEEASKKHIARLGKLNYIRGYIYKGKYGPKAGVIVRGENGTARFTGFSWGYRGTGPNGLFCFLHQVLNISVISSEKIAFQTPWEMKIGEAWWWGF